MAFTVRWSRRADDGGGIPQEDTRATLTEAQDLAVEMSAGFRAAYLDGDGGEHEVYADGVLQA